MEYETMTSERPSRRPERVVQFKSKGDYADHDLPEELRHDKIREVRNRCSWGMDAYQIVFDQSFMPYRYARELPDEWDITYARVEFHNDYDGVLEWIVPDKACITIVLTRRHGPDPFEVNQS